MKKYKVQITETLQKIVEVETEDGHEAWELVYGRYHDQDIILDASDFVDAEFEVVE